jgi:N-acetylglucosaminyl-diphospho-decaprenol L-rhamnosyltransferase
MIRVIVVAYHQPEKILVLLDSLKKFCTTPIEVVIHDNGGNQNTAQKWLSVQSTKLFPIYTIGIGKNVGFGAAVNRAADFVTGQTYSHLLLLNPDLVLASALDESVFHTLKTFSGITGFRVFNDAQKIHRQASARRFPSWKTAISGREGLLTRLFPKNSWSKHYLGTELDGEETQPVDWVSGCALWCPQPDWQRLKGFDEQFFLYVEDVDLGRKAKQLGLPVQYAPIVDVIHEIGGTYDGRRSLKSDYFHHLGMWQYHIKWNGGLGLLVGPIVFAGILLRFLVRRLF